MGSGEITGMGLGMGVASMVSNAFTMPSLPKAVQQPDPSDEAVQNARLMERRKQLGLQGRMSTFLTTAQGEGPSTSQPSSNPAPTSTLLGG